MKISIKLCVIAAVLAFTCFYQAPSYAQENPTPEERAQRLSEEAERIQAELDRIEESRKRDEQHVEDLRERNRGGDPDARRARERAELEEEMRALEKEKAEQAAKAQVPEDAGQDADQLPVGIVGLQSGGGCSLIAPTSGGLTSPLYLIILGAGILALVVRQGIKS